MPGTSGAAAVAGLQWGLVQLGVRDRSKVSSIGVGCTLPSIGERTDDAGASPVSFSRRGPDDPAASTTATSFNNLGTRPSIQQAVAPPYCTSSLDTRSQPRGNKRKAESLAESIAEHDRREYSNVTLNRFKENGSALEDLADVITGDPAVQTAGGASLSHEQINRRKIIPARMLNKADFDTKPGSLDALRQAATAVVVSRLKSGANELQEARFCTETGTWRGHLKKLFRARERLSFEQQDGGLTLEKGEVCELIQVMTTSNGVTYWQIWRNKRSTSFDADEQPKAQGGKQTDRHSCWIRQPAKETVDGPEFFIWYVVLGKGSNKRPKGRVAHYYMRKAIADACACPIDTPMRDQSPAAPATTADDSNWRGTQRGLGDEDANWRGSANAVSREEEAMPAETRLSAGANRGQADGDGDWRGSAGPVVRPDDAPAPQRESAGAVKGRAETITDWRGSAGPVVRPDDAPAPQRESAGAVKGRAETITTLGVQERAVQESVTPSRYQNGKHGRDGLYKEYASSYRSSMKLTGAEEFPDKLHSDWGVRLLCAAGAFSYV